MTIRDGSVRWNGSVFAAFVAALFLAVSSTYAVAHDHEHDHEDEHGGVETDCITCGCLAKSDVKAPPIATPTAAPFEGAFDVLPMAMSTIDLRIDVAVHPVRGPPLSILSL